MYVCMYELFSVSVVPHGNIVVATHLIKIYTSIFIRLSMLVQNNKITRNKNHRVFNFFFGIFPSEQLTISSIGP